ncbi:uncharacterized protein BDZ99DRAFT_20719 [Mytilinidion resinicola]|uniref:F-box domain-containing protein n=1 Tax=Mytilinidion resinicola TaxID=574789 RepID=A0A6A6Z9X9_9PEZI|nr:uncharacterized protein BDZ99DRAFT_20719 [Mytilinidion resinicola]KAF2817628.1 hypothetical protein BDZ99DRAFT_20719 [Mytilinidion resinicola]
MARRSKPSPKAPTRTFPLSNLPPELQFRVMANLDPKTLYNLVDINRRTKDLYLAYPEMVLRSVASQEGLQLRNLTLACLEILQAVRRETPLDLKHLDQYLSRTLDTENPGSILPCDTNPIAVLKDLQILHTDVKDLVEEYSKEIHHRACLFDNPGAVEPNFVLSTFERHRISRACWMLRFYGLLFYEYLAKFILLIEDFEPALGEGPGFPASVFFHRLCPSEVDEMLSVYQYTVRECRYVSSTAQHNSPCPGTNDSHWIRGSREPLGCQNCHFMTKNALWDVLRQNIVGDGLWALEERTVKSPSKIWTDWPSSNVPNPGWTFFNEARKHHNIERFIFISYFRNIGFFFWDQERLDAWHFIDFEGWEPTNVIRVRPDGLPNHNKDQHEVARGTEQKILEWSRANEQGPLPL